MGQGDQERRSGVGIGVDPDPPGLVDLLALYGLIFYDPLLVLAYWAGFNVVQLALAAYAFRLDREPLRPLWALPLQQFVYRQFMYAVIVQSVVAAIAGIRLRWHKLERTGIAVPESAGH